MCALFADLARRYHCHIQAGSMVEDDDGGQYVNRARLFGPEGGMGWQDKNVLTMWERTSFNIVPGNGSVTVFDIGAARVGIIICYDCEFPNAARALIEAGAEILLVPSCTETAAGYWRVRIGAMARALEGQCYVVHAPTVGEAPWSGVVELNSGAAGIYAPPDHGMPADGVIAIGPMNEPGWTYANLDLDALAAVRATGAVRGMAHWDEQPGAARPGAKKPDSDLTARLLRIL
jgi:predicted amidohydrolase